MDNEAGIEMESLDQFTEFKPIFDTHLDRLVKIVARHSKISRQHIDAITMYPALFEQRVVVDRVSDELKDLNEDAMENIADIMNDFLKLQEIFFAFQKEIENADIPTPPSI
jgi:5-bromo-4-chloroindolyl phosphate hydrolysis protein